MNRWMEKCMLQNVQQVDFRVYEILSIKVLSGEFPRKCKRSSQIPMQLFRTQEPMTKHVF